ncbi:MAG: NADH-quinone oxidoreductase subunit M [Opitutales bacterium]
MIAWTFITAFAGAGLLLLLPPERKLLARVVALSASCAGFAFALATFFFYNRAPGAETFQFAISRDWIPSAGIGFHLAADGISVVLLLLTGIIAITGVLFSWNVTQDPKRFFAFFLTIIGGVYGVFLSIDLFLLLVFYEIVILPKYFLIAGWGSTNRGYGAMKLTLYSIVGSALVMAAVMATYVVAGLNSFDLFDLAAVSYTPAFQAWAFPVMFLGFAILAGIWPFHTWAPTGHVAAPTAASMLLAGVVMKLGAYGALRVAMPLFPEGLDQWRMVFAFLAAVGIIYGALAALAQRDLKFVVGYSSISHMGFVLLGLVTLTTIGISGAVLQMFSHGIIAALLFGVVGRMIYDRTHTRDLTALGKLGLARALPFAAVTFVVASAASMGLPGFSGFIAEVTVLLGAWDSVPYLLLIVGPGIVVTVAFTLKALQASFFGGDVSGVDNLGAHKAPLLPISRPERIGALILMAVALGVGLHPTPLLDLILSSFDGALMSSLLK